MIDEALLQTIILAAGALLSAALGSIALIIRSKANEMSAAIAQNIKREELSTALIEDLRARVKMLEDSKHALELSYRDEVSRGNNRDDLITRLQEQLSELLLTHNTLQERFTELEKSHELACEDLNAVRAQLAAVQLELEAAQKELAEAKAQNLQLIEENTKEREAREDAEVKRQIAERDNHQLAKRVTELETEVHGLKARLDNQDTQQNVIVKDEPHDSTPE